MRELDPFVLFAVVQEMLGAWLWLLLALIALGTVAFIALLVRERRLISRRLMWSQAGGVAGGILALALMVEVSSSGYTDVGGPADWFLVALVFCLGLIGSAVVFYTISGWWRFLAGTAQPVNFNRN